MYESSTKETKWVCIQLACSRRPRALKEAHCFNIQAKFYNEKFPLVYESYMIWDSLSWRSWCYFAAQVWKKDSSIVPSLFFSHYFILFFVRSLNPSYGGIIVSMLTWDNALIMKIITLLLIYNSILRTKYDSMWMPPAVYRDMQWIKSDMYERIMKVALPQIRCQLHDHAKSNMAMMGRVIINRMVESCMAIYLGMAMEMP